MKNSKILLITFLFFIGIAFRLWFANVVSQPYGCDQQQYNDFAEGILKYGFFANSFRLYGYPLFIAFIYSFTGIVNAISSLPWKIAQAIVDSATALILYFTAKKIFDNKTPVWVVYIFYLFNPFTSVYTGVMLTEVLSTFILTLLYYFLVQLSEKKNVMLLFMTAVVLGYIPQVKLTFLYFTIILIVAIIYRMYKYWNLKFKHLLATGVLIIYLLPFTYNVIGNYRFFNQFSLTTVDNVSLKEFYISLFIDNISFHQASLFVLPPQVQMAYSQMGDAKDKNERKEINRRYTRLAIAEIKKDPKKFILSRFSKIWYVWEKHFIYWYNPAETEKISGIIYWGNCTLLLMSVVGLIIWGRKNRDKWLVGLFAFLFIYMSLIHTLSTAEERYSIPVYPIVFLFFGYGVWCSIGLIRLIRHNLSNWR